MAKYINADALLEEIEKIKKYDYFAETGNIFILLAHIDVASAIKRQPAADVRENVRGEWLFREDTETDMLECSNCGCRAIREPYEHALGTNGFKFCPYCGADMRGEEHTMEEYMMGQEGNPDDGSL